MICMYFPNNNNNPNPVYYIDDYKLLWGCYTLHSRCLINN